MAGIYKLNSSIPRILPLDSSPQQFFYPSIHVYVHIEVIRYERICPRFTDNGVLDCSASTSSILGFPGTFSGTLLSGNAFANTIIGGSGIVDRTG